MHGGSTCKFSNLRLHRIVFVVMIYINFNGSLHFKTDAIFTSQNRFAFGDGFIESFRVFNDKITFETLHENRIKASCEVLFLELEKFNLEEEVSKVLIANKLKNARVRIHFFRVGNGRYLPETNQCDFLVEAEDDNVQAFHLHTIETISLSKQYFKASHSLGNIKSSSALLFVLAAKEANKNTWNDAILLNENKAICEATSSNVFIRKSDGLLLTPPLNSGCVAGVMRQKVLQLLQQNSYQIYEQNFTVSELENAAEIFLTNATKGIQSVVKFNNKKLENNIAIELVSLLNKEIGL